MKRRGSYSPLEDGEDRTRQPGRTAGVGDHSARGITSRRIRVSRLRLIGRVNAGSAAPCADPPRIARYLRYALYVLAIAIAAAVTIKALYRVTQRAEEGQVSAVYGPAEPVAAEPLGAGRARVL